MAKNKNVIYYQLRAKSPETKALFSGAEIYVIYISMFAWVGAVLLLNEVWATLAILLNFRAYYQLCNCTKQDKNP